MAAASARPTALVRLALEDPRDLGPPFVKARLLFRQRQIAVGDVVDLAAEGVDREHRIATLRRQQPHRPVERGAGILDDAADFGRGVGFRRGVGVRRHRTRPFHIPSSMHAA